MIKTHTYDEVYLLNVTIKGDGTCKRNDPVMYHRREVINKMACYITDGTRDEDLVSEVYDFTCDTSISPGSKLYVASECGTGRDTFRNSGYHITRDAGNADVIVVPDVSASKYACLSCNFVAKGKDEDDKDIILLVTVYKTGYYGKEMEESDISIARSYVESAMAMEVDDASRTFIKVWFIPKCKELQNVMEGCTYSVPYIQESLVPVKPSTQFSAETLLFWENIDDENLLVRTICTSDWMKYPSTLWCFLIIYSDKKNFSNWYNYATGDFRRILQSIGYDSYDTFQYGLRDKSFSPEDFDMLQSYLFLRMGIDENGGMVDPKTWNKINPYLNEILQRRYVVKPFHIPSKMNVTNLKQLFR